MTPGPARAGQIPADWSCYVTATFRRLGSAIGIAGVADAALRRRLQRPFMITVFGVRREHGCLRPLEHAVEAVGIRVARDEH
jgi:hypothetical protein